MQNINIEDYRTKKIILNGEEATFEKLQEAGNKKGNKIKLIENGDDEAKFEVFVKNL